MTKATELSENVFDCPVAKGIYRASQFVHKAMQNGGLKRDELESTLANTLETLAVQQQHILDLEKAVIELCEQARLK